MGEEVENSFSSILERVTVMSDEDVEKYEAEQQKLNERRISAEKQAHFEKCGIGEKYFNVSWDSFKTDTEERRVNYEQVRSFCDNVKNGKPRTLWLLGANGNGKTMLAGLIAKELCGTYRRMYDVEDELKDADNFRNSENRVGVFGRYKKYKVLILDEVGRNPDGNEMRNLFHILNDRYEDDKTTVLCSNMDKASLSKYLGRALTDRFVENCTCVNFTGESYRKTVREAGGM